MSNQRFREKSLSNSLHSFVDLYKEIVDNYANVWVAVDKPPTLDHQVSDFVYFCLTKSCKSLIGTQALIKAGCGEDALTLIRTVYESYLKMVYVAHNPNDVSQFVSIPIGISSNFYSFAKTRKNKTDFRKVKDLATGTELPAPMSIEKIAMQSPYEDDRKFHHTLYTYLSENAHPHMMASGNYRTHPDEKRYTYQNSNNTQKALIFGIYVSSTMLDHFPYRNQFNSDLERRVTENIRVAIKKIDFYSTIEGLELDPVYETAVWSGLDRLIDML